MYASFLNLPVEGRHLRALHLKLFTVPSTLTTFCEGFKVDAFVKNPFAMGDMGGFGGLHGSNPHDPPSIPPVSSNLGYG